MALVPFDRFLEIVPSPIDNSNVIQNVGVNRVQLERKFVVFLCLIEPFHQYEAVPYLLMDRGVKVVYFSGYLKFTESLFVLFVVSKDSSLIIQYFAPLSSFLVTHLNFLDLETQQYVFQVVFETLLY